LEHDEEPEPVMQVPKPAPPVSPVTPAALAPLEETPRGAAESVERGSAKQVKGKTKSAREERQEQMTFEPVTRGRFEKSEPTIVDGQDLDVPAFMRMNVRVK
jgi:cell division protein FtsZ